MRGRRGGVGATWGLLLPRAEKRGTPDLSICTLQWRHMYPS